MAKANMSSNTDFANDSEGGSPLYKPKYPAENSIYQPN